MSLGAALWKLNGTKVTLILRSGEDLTGVLSMNKEDTSVGLPTLIHLTKVEGKEYFDAVILPQEIAAIQFRAMKTR